MKKYWIFSELYYPELTSTGYFLTRIAEALGVDSPVQVITGPATVNLKTELAPNTETINNVKVHRVRGSNFSKNWIPGRLVNMITKTLGIFLKGLLCCNCNDLVLVVTNPPLLPFAALLIKWIKGSEYVLLIHDVYPEALFASGITTPASIVSILFSHANKILYEQASHIITLGRDMSELARTKIPLHQDSKVTCIPNWADTDIVFPTQRSDNNLLVKLGINNRFIILYAGNLGRTHNIEIIAHAALFFHKQHNKKVHFLFVGTGAKKKWLENFILQEGLSNISLLPFLPNSEKVITLNACDVGIISLNSGMNGVSVPSRMYNQMAAGKPIIAVADDLSELSEVVREEKIGWIVNPSNVMSLVTTIEFAVENPDICQAMGKRASDVVCEKYTYEKISNDYRRLFRSLT